MSIMTFDEKAQTALRLLMEKFWILRLEEPEMYKIVRERENMLKRYVDEKLGFELIVHQHFIKLEKIPVEAKSWMGIGEFQEARDYAIFCCALAYTENSTVDEQFLLSDICEDIKDMYPGDIALDWTNYNHRRSLVRVIKQMEKMRIMKTVEGEIEQFAMHEGQEVLYETTIYARYFMRTFPKDLTDYESMEEILASEWERHEVDFRRKRVYRKLMTSPVVYRETEEDADFAYIRNYRNRLRDDLEEHTLFRLEVFKNAALLVSDERKQELTLFPDQKAIMDIALHFASYIRDHDDQFQPNELGNIRMTPIMFEQTIKALRQINGAGWSKQYREGAITAIVKDLLEVLINWEMLKIESETDVYVIRPLLGRIAGDYPKRFWEEMEAKQLG